jgi:hypothetical protein
MAARLSWFDITPLSPTAAPAQGSMGVVLAATHRCGGGVGRKVAVKVFKTAALAAGELERALSHLRAEVDKMARASEGPGWLRWATTRPRASRAAARSCADW